MKIFNGKYEGDLHLHEDLKLSGMVVGTVTVPNGLSLVLTGAVVGDLVVEYGSMAIVRGTVNGTVMNRGGNVEILGTVQAVKDLGNTKSKIASHALIRGN